MRDGRENKTQGEGEGERRVGSKHITYTSLRINTIISSRDTERTR